MGGERDPRAGALRNYRIKADEATIVVAGRGGRFELTQARVPGVDKIAQCDREIDRWNGRPTSGCQW